MTPACVNHPADTAVLIAAHGSSRAPETAETALAHAARLRARGVFAEVRAGFVKQAPFLADALAEMKAPRVVIAPFMASDGWVTSRLMPEALGIAEHADPRVIFAEAAGTHPAVARACAHSIRARLQGAVDRHVMVIGHGTGRSPANENAARRFTAALMRALPAGISSETVFLEREPRLADRAARLTRPVTFAVPFLMAGGCHLTTDVPEGLARARKHTQSRVILMRAIGFEPVMTDALEARALDALARASAAA